MIKIILQSFTAIMLAILCTYCGGQPAGTGGKSFHFDADYVDQHTKVEQDGKTFVLYTPVVQSSVNNANKVTLEMSLADKTYFSHYLISRKKGVSGSYILRTNMLADIFQETINGDGDYYYQIIAVYEIEGVDYQSMPEVSEKITIVTSTNSDDGEIGDDSAS